MKKSVSIGMLFLRIAWAALPYFWISATFLITWIAPDTFGERNVYRLTYVMILEFLVVHSTGFFTAINARDSSKWERGLMFFVLLCFYCLFGAAFSVSYGGPWPLIAILTLSLLKLPGIMRRPMDGDAQFSGMAYWAGMTALYLASTFATVVYDVPALGVTEDVIKRQGFTVGGVWPEQPYRVMAMGVLYFAGLGLLNIIAELIAYRAAVNTPEPKFAGINRPSPRQR